MEPFLKGRSFTITSSVTIPLVFPTTVSIFINILFWLLLEPTSFMKYTPGPFMRTSFVSVVKVLPLLKM